MTIVLQLQVSNDSKLQTARLSPWPRSGVSDSDRIDAAVHLPAGIAVLRHRP